MGRKEDDERDIRIINEHADALNAEAEDFLEYQVDPWETCEPLADETSDVIDRLLASDEPATRDTTSCSG